jgi:hypothetical protein
VEVNVFFLLHLTCGRRKEGGLVFSKLLFSLLSGHRRGFKVLFLLIC